MIASDTTAAAAATHLRLYREAGASRRATIAAELSDAVRQTVMAGIVRRHPDLSERERAEAFLALVYGAGRHP